MRSDKEIWGVPRAGGRPRAAGWSDRVAEWPNRVEWSGVVEEFLRTPASARACEHATSSC
jgi:hypothetical protein